MNKGDIPVIKNSVDIKLNELIRKNETLEMKLGNLMNTKNKLTPVYLNTTNLEQPNVTNEIAKLKENIEEQLNVLFFL